MYPCIFTYNKSSAEGYVAPKQTWTVGWSQMLTDERTNGQRTGSLYHAMSKAGATIMNYRHPWNSVIHATIWIYSRTSMAQHLGNH